LDRYPSIMTREYATQFARNGSSGSALFISVHILKRENVIVNRLNKTKVERAVDHEAERIERVKHENAVKRAAAAAKKKADLELAEARKAEKAARSYDSFLDAEDDENDKAKAIKTKYRAVTLAASIPRAKLPQNLPRIAER